MTVCHVFQAILIKSLTLYKSIIIKMLLLSALKMPEIALQFLVHYQLYLLLVNGNDVRQQRDTYWKYRGRECGWLLLSAAAGYQLMSTATKTVKSPKKDVRHVLGETSVPGTGQWWDYTEPIKEHCYRDVFSRDLTSTFTSPRKIGVIRVKHTKLYVSQVLLKTKNRGAWFLQAAGQPLS